MIEAILAVLMSFAASTRDQVYELPMEREARLRVVAKAIESASNRAACYQQDAKCRAIIGDRYVAAAVLVVQAHRESALRADVQRGQCRASECDRGRAMGPWQLHHAPWRESREQWLAYGTDEGLEAGAWRAITLWAGGSHGGTKPECGFARLAGWGICWGDYGHDRAAQMRSIARRIRA